MPKSHLCSGVSNLYMIDVLGLCDALTELVLSGAHTLVVIGRSNHLYNPIFMYAARGLSSFIYVLWLLHLCLRSSLYFIFSLDTYVILPGVGWKRLVDPYLRSLDGMNFAFPICPSSWYEQHFTCLISCCQSFSFTLCMCVL